MTDYKYPQGSVFYRKSAFARPMISHASGIYLYDHDGNEYIDGSGGPLVVNVGHGRTEVIEAMQRQLNEAAYVHATMFTSEALERYAAEIAPLLPMKDPRIFPLSSGSEVVEGAIKLARQIQMARGENERNLIISRHQSYHGMTLGALSISGRPGMRRPYMQMLRDMPHIDPPYPYRHPATGEELASLLEEEILHLGAHQVAAFIAEPISGAGLGSIVPPSDYWPIVRQICDHYGLLLIVDEVLVGFGRTGKWWGIDHWDVKPDILVTSKGAAGGYFPFGFLAAASSDVGLVIDKFGDFNHGGTFSHHAVGAAAGLAVLRLIRDERLVENSARLGALLGALLSSDLGEHPHIGDIRGRGLFWSVELVEDRDTKKPFDVSEHLATRIWKKAFESGLIVYYSQGCADGTNGDLAILGPPLIATEEQIRTIAARFSQAVKAVLA
ncbi:MAG: aspartate aminotransferase family protein [Candidatus Promineifilaceae bacterium]